MAVQYAFGKIVTQGLDLNVDAADPTSYPGTGTTWTSVVNRSITGSLVSCSFSSDFKGGIVFNNPSASVEFPGTVANYGTGSFTIEMAFRPSHIEGIHYLVSKNSGSFPNWGVYLSGSGGSGKLFAEYRINASVSCSVSSSTVFVTGSTYFVDAIFDPFFSSSYIFEEGSYNSTGIGNGSGVLTTTGSIFLGNVGVSSFLMYSGSIFNIKIYESFSNTLGNSNLKTQAYRFNLPLKNVLPVDYLVVAGGGGGSRGGGGGAGGVLSLTATLNTGQYPVTVGKGGLSSNTTLGNNGDNSTFITSTCVGGGGGAFNSTSARNGGSGGGTYSSFTPGAGIAGQGNSGGVATNNAEGTGGGGGGGGVGTPGSSSYGGSGSYFENFTQYGSPSGWYGGGGSGWGIVGGIGGGGDGGRDPQSGVANTGGGGGRRGNGSGGNGGSGVVIIRYQSATPLASGGIITTTGSYTYHAFTSTGSSTFTVL
jgi:hypothetical protein